nr:vacuolar sorting protein 18-like [Coffea arabica]
MRMAVSPFDRQDVGPSSSRTVPFEMSVVDLAKQIHDRKHEGMSTTDDGESNPSRNELEQEGSSGPLLPSPTTQSCEESGLVKKRGEYKKRSKLGIIFIGEVKGALISWKFDAEAIRKSIADMNLTLTLIFVSLQEDESSLLRFLQCKFGKGRSSGPEFFYDPKYALRLCLKEKRMRACVHIYSMMSMHEEAVALALQVDPELAMAEADKVEDDEELRKKLWLMVAKHVIEQEKGTKRENIRKAIAFLKETDGLLKIEDILPFFPDFALIDDFKEAICSSLEDYNEQIENLKQEMNDATHGADNIRNDISALAQRYAVIDRDEECGVCRKKILNVGRDYQMSWGYTSAGSMAPFYVFPCGHAFHAQCLITHVTGCTSQMQAEYILDLQKQLTLLSNEPRKDSSGGLSEEEPLTSMTPLEKIRSQLDDAIASECPFCGDLMIREISLPFILPEEADVAASWEIKPHNAGMQKSLSLPAY